MPARDESSGQDIAIKTADMSNPTNAKIAYDEAQLALTLPQHPNVVHYLACEQAEEAADGEAKPEEAAAGEAVAKGKAK